MTVKKTVRKSPAKKAATADQSLEAEKAAEAEKVAEAEKAAESEKAAEAEKAEKAEKAAEAEKAEKAAEAEKAEKAEKAAIPVFDESGRTTIVGGIKGVQYRQNGNHFSASKKFVGKAE